MEKEKNSNSNDGYNGFRNLLHEKCENRTSNTHISYTFQFHSFSIKILTNKKISSTKLKLIPCNFTNQHTQYNKYSMKLSFQICTYGVHVITMIIFCLLKKKMNTSIPKTTTKFSWKKMAPHDISLFFLLSFLFGFVVFFLQSITSLLIDDRLLIARCVLI